MQSLGYISDLPARTA